MCVDIDYFFWILNEIWWSVNIQTVPGAILTENKGEREKTDIILLEYSFSSFMISSPLLYFIYKESPTGFSTMKLRMYSSLFESIDKQEKRAK